MPFCVKTFVARRRHEGSKETSLARIKGKKATDDDSCIAVETFGNYIFLPLILASEVSLLPSCAILSLPD